MKEPLISVVIPALNEEAYLDKALSALRNQDYSNFEIIVVDNASTDKTNQIAKKKADKVVFEKRQGMIPARQRGFAEARGEIIARTDADTIPPKDWLSRCYSILDNNPQAAAVIGTNVYHDGGFILSTLSRIGFLFFIYLGRLIMGHYPLNGPNSIMRRNQLKKTKPHLEDRKVHEDIDLGCHLSVYGDILFVPSIVMPISARRAKTKPWFIFEYLLRSARSILLHHPSHRLHNVR